MMAVVDETLKVAGSRLVVLFDEDAPSRKTAVDPFPELAAEETVGGHPQRLSVEVVEGEVDGGNQMMIRDGALEIVRAQEFVGFGDAGGVATDKELVVLADDSGNVAALAVRGFAQADGTVVDVDFDDEVPGDVSGDARCFDLMGFNLRDFHGTSNGVRGQPIRTNPDSPALISMSTRNWRGPLPPRMPVMNRLSARQSLYTVLALRDEDRLVHRHIAEGL